jgi:aryl-alcohol dehydrogenase-like predicted oxidoreductase
VIIQDTTLSASRIGLGTHSLHRLSSSGARQRLLAQAHELGLSYFDTAPSYGAGIAEYELGSFMRDKRSRVVLTTKFGIATGRMGSRIPGWNYAAMAGRLAKRVFSRRRGAKAAPRDYTSGQAKSSVEGSLRALKTDHIDVLYLHEPTLELLTDEDSLTRTLEELKACGKVRYVGLSGHASSCTDIARRHPRLAEVLQVEIPAGADGLPDKACADTAAAVRFWEFAPGPMPTGRLGTVLERLLAAAPQSVTLLSTNSGASLREALDILGKFDKSAPRSATSSLA